MMCMVCMFESLRQISHPNAPLALMHAGTNAAHPRELSSAAAEPHLRKSEPITDLLHVMAGASNRLAGRIVLMAAQHDRHRRGERAMQACQLHPGNLVPSPGENRDGTGNLFRDGAVQACIPHTTSASSTHTPVSACQQVCWACRPTRCSSCGPAAPSCWQLPRPSLRRNHSGPCC